MIPENNIRLLQLAILLHPSGKSFTNSRILIWKFPSWKALIPLIFCNPKVVIEKSSSPEKLGIWAC
jgi:hypothetical protein